MLEERTVKVFVQCDKANAGAVKLFRFSAPKRNIWNVPFRE